MPSVSEVDEVMKRTPRADTALLNAEHLASTVSKDLPQLIRQAFHVGFHAGREYEQAQTREPS